MLELLSIFVDFLAFGRAECSCLPIRRRSAEIEGSRSREKCSKEFEVQDMGAVPQKVLNWLHGAINSVGNASTVFRVLVANNILGVPKHLSHLLGCRANALLQSQLRSPDRRL